MSALRRREAAAPVAREARVSNPDPDELTVTIDDFDGSEMARHAWPVAAWPRGGGALPARGDRCLVVMSEIGRAWVVAAEWSGDPLTWRPLVLATARGWQAQDPVGFPLDYAKGTDGWVTLRGLARNSAAPTQGDDLLGTLLPEGFRPASRRTFPSFVTGGLLGRFTVTPDGHVVVGELPRGLTGVNYWTLDGIGYWAEN
jgi:hypothetical protein